jgi:hypothetical protein
MIIIGKRIKKESAVRQEWSRSSGYYTNLFWYFVSVRYMTQIWFTFRCHTFHSSWFWLWMNDVASSSAISIMEPCGCSILLLSLKWSDHPYIWLYLFYFLFGSRTSCGEDQNQKTSHYAHVVLCLHHYTTVFICGSVFHYFPVSVWEEIWNKNSVSFN